jgi:hypothetical protein
MAFAGIAWLDQGHLVPCVEGVNGTHRPNNPCANHNNMLCHLLILETIFFQEKGGAKKSCYYLCSPASDANTAAL